MMFFMTYLRLTMTKIKKGHLPPLDVLGPIEMGTTEGVFNSNTNNEIILVNL